MSSAAASAGIDYLYMYNGAPAGAGPLVATDMVNIISHARIMDKVTCWVNYYFRLASINGPTSIDGVELGFSLTGYI